MSIVEGIKKKIYDIKKDIRKEKAVKEIINRKIEPEIFREREKQERRIALEKERIKADRRLRDIRREGSGGGRLLRLQGSLNTGYGNIGGLGQNVLFGGRQIEYKPELKKRKSKNKRKRKSKNKRKRNKEGRPITFQDFI